MTRADRWQNRECVARYWEYKDNLQAMAEACHFRLDDGYSFRFVLPMPKSWSDKKRAEMVAKPHRQKPDLDNLLKGVFDALLVDDSKIYLINRAEKIWGTVGRVEVYKLD
jgi:Holliday junction resolvase RusA-like endonuclease